MRLQKLHLLRLLVHLQTLLRPSNSSLLRLSKRHGWVRGVLLGNTPMPMRACATL